MEHLERVALRSALENRFDRSPIATLCVDEFGKVLYRNPMSRVVLGEIRLRSALWRHLDIDCPAESEVVCATVREEDLFLFWESAEDFVGVRVVYLHRLQDAFSQEFASVLSEYEADLIALTQRTLQKPAPEKEIERYRIGLSKQMGSMKSCNRFLNFALRGVRDLSPEKTLAVSAGEFVEFFAASVREPLDNLGVTLKTTWEHGIVALFNFRHFCDALLHLLNFLISFALSKQLELKLVQGVGECTFELSGEDKHEILSLYRLFCRRELSQRQMLRESALFFPLFLAMFLLQRYKHRVSLFHENGRLFVRIRVATTLEFPTLVVREDEEYKELALQLAEGVLRLPAGFFGIEQKPQPVGRLRLNSVQCAKLFD